MPSAPSSPMPVKSLEELVTGDASPVLSGKRLFMTGATGFLGSHFLFWRRQLGGHVTSLVRGSDVAEARQRLAARLEEAAASYHLAHREEAGDSTSTVVLGDISQPLCGIAPEAIERLREDGVDELWHFAASLNYEERKRLHIEEQNVAGTHNAIELARAIGAKHLLYVSTAYTVGKRRGRVEEVLHDPESPFNNFYERSKCGAEHEVARTCTASGLAYRILRPSIVVGPSQTLRPGGTGFGLYGFVSALRKLRGALDVLDHEITILAHPNTPMHFVPIDSAVRDMLYLAEHGFPGGPIYHLTGAGSTTARQVVDAACELIGMRRMGIGTRDHEPTPLESVLDRRTEFYGGYLRDPKEFVRSLPGETAITEADLHGYIREYLREVEKEAADETFQRSVARSFDGSRLAVYDGGNPDGPPVVLINAFGMPVDFFLPIAHRLESRYRLLTWESRGVPSVSRDFDPECSGPEAHARDLETLLEDRDIESAHVIGWSTGAQIALRFASLFPNRVRSAALLNGSYCMPDDVPASEFRQNMIAVMPKIAASLGYARIYHQMIYGNRESQSYGILSRDERNKDQLTLANMLVATDPFLLNMTSVPFRTPEALYRYANMITRYVIGPEHAWTEGFDKPTLVVTGDLDVVSHPEESVRISSLIEKSRLVWIREGDHFSLYDRTELCDALGDFLAEVEPAG